MSLALLAEAMERGDVLLSTLHVDILPDALTDGPLHDVTATIWNATTGTWCQHFADVLDAPAVEAILELRGQKPPAIV